MRTVFMILVLVTAVASAEYVAGSMHMNDAMAVNEILTQLGYSTSEFKVVIGPLGDEGGIHYAVSWQNDRYSSNVDDSLEKVMASILAAGIVSEQTTWTSSSIIIGFDDAFFLCSTSAARYLVAHSNSMSTDDFGVWLLSNVSSIDR